MKPVVRLHLYFAADNDQAVILRQGPSKQFRMISWDRSDDTFQDGQWLKHSVYPERCDLSPDGRHFIYFALNGDWSGPSEGAYTAISHTPYFTAVALFPEGNTWGGGGRFLDNTLFWAGGGKDIINRAKGLVRLTRSHPTADCESGLRAPDGKCAKIGKAKAGRLLDADRHVPAELSHYDTQGGCLYRRSGGEMTLIRDFTDMTFEPVRAPYDWRDEISSAPDVEDLRPWHPLDGEQF